jgi:hypothetical protein
MGDGHHGWAAAEVALSLRSAFVREMWTLDNDISLDLPRRSLPGLVSPRTEIRHPGRPLSREEWSASGPSARKRRFS